MEITKACSECHEVKFRIKSQSGKYKAICVNCGNVEAEVNIERYERVTTTCQNCDSRTFKIRSLKEGRTEYWSLRCSECGTIPEFEYCDENGRGIDRNTRELLLIQDSISELKEKVDSLESDINSLEGRVNIIDNSIDTYDYELRGLKGDISSMESNISSLESDISNLEWRIGNIE
ncbi:hypothetical protein [Clostridium sp. OS1-26]|uniref:hypothetical protein n=1 Tax=Clostridium sp. OS1-26 TaxID=3070681 RepID=UPI0027E18D03|nr:hypothetical protein [Clostridium sp. OS1-26]WML33195.1 hypothetical protein RCG18_17805 [Clostridium sp. OS1-26]